MYWQDIEDNGWEGITMDLSAADVGRAPAWCVDVVRPGRVPITAGDAARWWGRQRPGWEGVGLLRGTPMAHDDAVVRAITTGDLQAATAAPGTIAWWRHWSRWFVDAMVASGRSPLRPGLWGVMRVTCTDVASLTVVGSTRRRDAPPSRWDVTRTTIRRAQGDPWTEDLFEEDWNFNGSHALLPMRRAARADNGRVKARRGRRGCPSRGCT